ncbi:heme peroxidase 4 [Heterobasidion irregulare TC 32-1]|uniref:Heme peroxidase 4 n=1 Tax=Heterobasidion irregulare (strain TC 32-1) TaxID=747525 RepID=W4KF18_HETIT|nr:heme peroxidase 4 [Heterobasidion irregulare TC 32-1]ETW83661.1 heme peroxidase 4 [Heterobasidion irregulare TC 32-1]
MDNRGVPHAPTGVVSSNSPLKIRVSQANHRAWLESIRRVNKLSVYPSIKASAIEGTSQRNPLSMSVMKRASAVVVSQGYSVVRDAFRVENNIITIKLSDGEGREPPPDEYDLEDKTFSVYKVVGLDDAASVHWRTTIGKLLAVHTLGRPLRPSEPKWKLGRFPKGYTLYVHLNGEMSNKLNARRDYYLYGSTTSKVPCFRSPYEFAFHVEWLMKSMPTKPNHLPDCRCTYCSGVKQWEVTQMLRGKDIRNQKNNPHQVRNTRKLKALYKPIRTKDNTHMESI